MNPLPCMIGPDAYDLRLGDRVVGRVERRPDTAGSQWCWEGFAGDGGRQPTLDLALRAWEQDWVRVTRYARFGQSADGSVVIELDLLTRRRAQTGLF